MQGFTSTDLSKYIPFLNSIIKDETLALLPLGNFDFIIVQFIFVLEAIGVGSARGVSRVKGRRSFEVHYSLNSEAQIKDNTFFLT